MPYDRYNEDLVLSTTLTRQTAEFGPIECDVVLFYSARMTSRGCRARTWGDPDNCYPAEPAEFDLRLDRIEFDGEPDDAPGPLTQAEQDLLTAWFHAHEDRAAARASDLDEYAR